ncbi:CpaF family protein [Ferroacidibacillus organovorans]|uniref:CpaF family protein n=1 Tax=Ferroacidibacillus organovorans TaxID=1765683 RepID=UPI0009ED0157|nr:CpaF family protein [Ferroacidibacillus organovorans]
MSLTLRDRMERRKTTEMINEYKAVDEYVPHEVREAPTQIVNTGVTDLKTKLHIQLVDRLTEQENEEEYESVFLQALAEDGIVLPKADRDRLWSELRAEIRGFGPIDPFLHDETISEVMVVAPDQVYIERKGKLELTEIRFKDADHVHRIIEKIVAPIGRRIDESVPYVDARLPDGSRVHAIIPPLALKGPCLTIRKFSAVPLQVSDLIHFGTLTPPMAEFLRAAINARLNIVISGGTGSGKTTTLNVVSNFIREDERIITIEDAAELKLQQRHLVTLEARPANVEGRGAVSIRDLVKNALRMRPDRIVVGEVRGAEALDMLQAMNTGHDGSLTTAHANTPRDMLRRLETMVMMAGMDLPMRAIREQIASAVDLIVQQSRLSDGGRKVTYITEVMGMEGDQIVLQDIFTFEQRGRRPDGTVIGKHRATGIVPACTEAMQAYGIPFRMDWFQALDE